MENFIGLGQERNDFVMQAMTFYRAGGVSINHFIYDVSRISKNHDPG